MTLLHPKLAAFGPELVIFDKDGTLINFHAMWGGWLKTLGERLENATGRPVSQPLFAMMGFDPANNHIEPGGHLAITPVPQFGPLIINVLRQAGLTAGAAEEALAATWYTPNPVALARPLADLPRLFTTLHAHKANIAVATSDDRAPTQTLLDAWELAPLVSALVCADDGIPIKPAPDMILSICRRLNIAPARAVMVGDNPDDLKMGRAAGVGLTVGVLSGVSSAKELTDYANLLLASIHQLLQNNS